jgi:putative oxidoreductase
MQSATRRHLIPALVWTLKIVAALFFLSAGVSKLVGAERQILLFDIIGWGDWFRYVTGVMEIVGAVLLLFPLTSALGALILFGISVGALVTLVALERSVLPALLTLLWTGALLIIMRDRLLRDRSWAQVRD